MRERFHLRAADVASRCRLDGHTRRLPPAGQEREHERLLLPHRLAQPKRALAHLLFLLGHVSADYAALRRARRVCAVREAFGCVDTMLVLGIDTSGMSGGITLAQGDDRSFQALETVPIAGGTFSAQLVPTLAALLQKHGY